MPTLTIRNVPESVHQALRLRAAVNKNSTEQEVRLILEATVSSTPHFVDELLAIGKQLKGGNKVEALEFKRDKRPFIPEPF